MPAAPGSAARLFATPDVETTTDGDVVLLRSRTPLAEHEQVVGAWLTQWAEQDPDRVLFAERPGGDPTAPWNELSYGEAHDRARRVGAALIEMGVAPDRPLAVLSGPSIDHGLLMLACATVGVPIVPISEAYSLRSASFERIHYVLEKSQAGAVFAQSSDAFGSVLAELGALPVITGDGGHGAPLSDLLSADPAGVDARAAEVDASTVAKILFTSGSTGRPKGVVTTHRMLTSNQQAMAQVWPFLDHEPPIICDWLPWSHTFGGSHNVNLVLRNGGTMYLDGGRPAPGLIDVTVANLADVRPTLAFNVPAGWARLAEQLDAAPDIAASVFERLRIIFYAGAALSADVWDRLAALVDRHAPGQVAMVSSWGMTETAPAALAVHMPLDRSGVIGTPLPGTTVKLLPNGPKTEIRVSGPNVMPGYLDDPEQNEAAFDEDGFFLTGDAVRFADPDDPNAGLVFDGRIGEDFKLSTGTWVSVGHVRTEAVAVGAPYVLDVVVTGLNRDWVGLLVWLVPGQEDSPELRAELAERFAEANVGRGSSSAIRRIKIESEPFSIEAGEITDKGYVNQGAVLSRRAASVDALHADSPTADIITIP